MATVRQVVQLIKNEYAQANGWREVQRLHHPIVPFGTLERIVKTDGEYFPLKWRAYFGINRRVKRAPRRMKLHEIPQAELAAMLNDTLARIGAQQ